MDRSNDGLYVTLQKNVMPFLLDAVTNHLLIPSNFVKKKSIDKNFSAILHKAVRVFVANFPLHC